LKKNYFLGIDIGGTKCTVVAGTEAMEILGRKQFPTDHAGGAYSTIAGLIESASAIIGNLKDHRLLATGISCGGPLDSRKGLILSPPNLPGWDNIPIVKIIKAEFGAPAFLQNDANACALAEWKFGAGKGTGNMVFLTFGTGMGAGIILNGRLYSGTNDLAGEVGHIRLAEDGPEGYGKKGSFEGFCSGGGISKLAKSIVLEKIRNGQMIAFCPNEHEADNITAKVLADFARKGDKTALEIFEISGEYLGRGLSVLIDILNPQRIVIGSIYARATQFLEPACRKVIEREALPPSSLVCEIVPAALGDEVGEYACLCVAIDGMKMMT
jgi:glucokinase